MKVSLSPRYTSDYMNDLQNQYKYKFSATVCKQNEVAATAIQSLDCLNDQIVQYIVSSQSPSTKDGDFPVPNESVHSSMVLIRRLLLDAQSRFRKMVDDNKKLATHFDTSIQAANQEVSMLRAELTSTSRRLSQISLQEEKVDKVTQVDRITQLDKATQVNRGLASASLSAHKKDEDKKELKIKVQALIRANEQLEQDKQHLLETHEKLKCTYEAMKTNENLRAENLSLENQLKTLRKELDGLQKVKVEEAVSDMKPSYGEIKLELTETRHELNRAKDVLQSMKSDRKRLKSEKLDLLGQMKQLYTTLEEKEMELRDFIHNYEQRVKESDEMIKQFAKEKEEMEKEKWEIITKAKDAIERAMFFKAELDVKEENIRELETQLKEIKEHLDSKVSSMLTSAPTASDGNIKTETDDEVFASIDETGFSTMEESSVLNCTFSQDLENNGQISSSSQASNADSAETSGSIFKWFTHSSDFELPQETKLNKMKRKTLGSFTRVFNRGRLRRSVALPHAESLMADESGPKLRVLNQDNYQEKLNTIEKMIGVHMKEWRAHQVLAWLEITLAMPMYAQNCLSNVKSGKVLLGLSDSELSAALGVTNPMHRRKLRLAIEQHRNPNEIKYLKASEMDPTWIAHRFLLDIGLPQYTNIFEEQLCDGHVLNTLSRRDLEKHFSVHRKFHQSSILHAIELLRRTDFNKEKLYHRHSLSEDKDTDLIVWTNERLMKWLRSIDLGEYCESLAESGVHGALMVLEPSFGADNLASILGIPPSKSYIRRHLASELDTILKPARVAMDTDSKEKTGDKNRGRKSSQDKGHRGYEERSHRKSQEEGRSRLSFRGSLGRAFGKKIREDLKLSFDSDTSNKMISAPIPIQHSSLSSLNNDSELVKKGFCVRNSQMDLSSCGFAGDSKLNDFLGQNIQQKRLTPSDQTLHKGSDLHAIYERNGDRQFEKCLKPAAGNEKSNGILMMRQENRKDSLASSQETLTEQSVKNENSKYKKENVQSKISACPEMLENLKFSNEKNKEYITVHNSVCQSESSQRRLIAESELLEKQTKKVDTESYSQISDTQEVSSKFISAKNSWVSVKGFLPQTTSV